MLSPGKVLQNRYRIKRTLAQGGMGAVYEAEAIHLGNALVAVKEAFFSEEWLREQFQREAATLARLRHPTLPQVKDHFIDDDGQFLVMEFIPGNDLRRLLSERLKDRGEPFGWQVVTEWADRLLDALEYIHSQHPQVIHRDIKPANLKLTPHGELFLIDFGLAKDATTPTRLSKSIPGFTLPYAPPEQVKGTGTDARSDLYSLGATLYHLLTGRPPVDATVREEVIKHNVPDPLKPADEVEPKVPVEIGQIITRAMSLNRDERSPNSTAMRQSLGLARQNIEAEFERRRRQEEERQRQERARWAEEQRSREEETRRLATLRAMQERQAEEERKHRKVKARQQEAEQQWREEMTYLDREETLLHEAQSRPRSKLPGLAATTLTAIIFATLLYLFWQHQYLLLIIILAIVLILSGANRLPQFAKAMGESIRNFKEGYREGMAESDHPKIGRNEDCPCGSGKKYKKCHELKFKAHQRKTE
jgi:TatA/E family protein of Tat protein translocase